MLPELGSLAELNRTYPIGDPLPHFSFGGKTPDDCVRVYTMKSSVFNGDDLMLDYSTIGEYMNPSVLLFRKRLLVIAPLQIGDTGPEHRKPTGTIEFKWLNSSKHPFYTSEEYLGVSEKIRALNWLFVGEDPRVLYYNDSFFQVYYTYTGRWLGRNHQKMGMADISYLPSEDRINITYLASPIIGKLPIDNSINQKNWSPFLLDGEALLVQSIHPLIIVRIHGYGTDNLVASVIASSDYSLSGHLGEIRGGTNAIPLPGRANKTYLSFYHSRTRLPWSSMTSYIYGAYTFIVGGTPGAWTFTMQSISPTPIMEPRKLYMDKWAGRYIDYCVYPMYIALQDEAPNVLHLSFGYQDHYGYVASFNLTRLLATLVPVS